MDLEKRIEELIESWINGNCYFVVDQIAGFSRDKAMYIIVYMCNEESFKSEIPKLLRLLRHKIDETTM